MVYTIAEITNIVTNLVMKFSFFPKQSSDQQYTVVMVLPADHNVVLTLTNRERCAIVLMQMCIDCTTYNVFH